MCEKGTGALEMGKLKFFIKVLPLSLTAQVMYAREMLSSSHKRSIAGSTK